MVSGRGDRKTYINTQIEGAKTVCMLFLYNGSLKVRHPNVGLMAKLSIFCSLLGISHLHSCKATPVNSSIIATKEQKKEEKLRVPLWSALYKRTCISFLSRSPLPTFPCQTQRLRMQVSILTRIEI